MRHSPMKHRLLNMPKDALMHHLYSLPSSYFLLNHQEHGFWIKEGNARYSTSILLEITEDRIVVADTEKKELFGVNGNGVEHIQFGTTLDRNGNSFEGNISNNKPYGWGVLYDKNHNRIFEGFRVGENSSCFGRSYYPENQQMCYEGEYCNGKRWGRGIEYDKKGTIVFDGEWLNDERLNREVKITSHDDLFHTHIEELTITNGMCNEEDWTVLDMTAFSLLRHVTIGDDCFDKVHVMKIADLAQLEDVTIGKNCFLNGGQAHKLSTEFTLKNCPKVKILTIAYQSFYMFGQFALENLPSLEEMSIGAYCFQCCGKVNIAHFAALKKVRIGKNSFAQSKLNRGDFCLHDCPLVELVELEENACYHTLCCVIKDNPKLTHLRWENGCFHSTMELNLSGDDSLQELHVGMNCFAARRTADEKIETVRLSHLTGLKEVEIQSGSFLYWGGLELEDLESLEQVTVGNDCFTLKLQEFKKGADVRFILKDCPKAEKLTIGTNSFLACNACEFSNLPALTAISIGSVKYADLNQAFHMCSLELRSGVFCGV